MQPFWFAKALRQGQGRAARYVEAAGLAAVKEEVLAALVWVHDQTPCSNCRFQALRELHGRQQLSPELLRDAAYDAHLEIRIWAAPSLNKVCQSSGEIHQT